MAPRSRAERRRDTLQRLVADVDCWVASAQEGEPYLTPLSFDWDGTALLLSTNRRNPTAQNLRATGRTRLGLGHTRDAVLVEGEVVTLDGVDQATGDAFAAKTGFDPRTLAEPYDWFRVVPIRIQAWREVDELPGRGRDAGTGSGWTEGHDTDPHDPKRPGRWRSRPALSVSSGWRGHRPGLLVVGSR